MSQEEKIKTPSKVGAVSLFADARAVAAWAGLSAALAVSLLVIVYPENTGYRAIALSVALCLIGLVAFTDMLRRPGSDSSGDTSVDRIDVLDAFDDPILVTDRSGRVKVGNAAFYSMIPAGGGQFKSVRDLSIDDEQSFYKLQRAARDGIAADASVVFSGPGPITAADVSVRPAAGGQTVIWSVHPKRGDVVAAEPVQSEGFEDAPYAGMETDAEGGVLTVNAMLRDMAFGAMDAEVIDGITISDILTGHDQMPAGDSVSLAQLRAPSGLRQVCWVSFNVDENRCRHIIIDAPSVPSMPVLPANDAEDARLIRLLNKTPIGTVIIDDQGKIIEANSAFLSLTKRRRVSGKTFADLVDQVDYDEVTKRLADAVRGIQADAPMDIKLAGENASVAQMYANRIDDHAVHGAIIYLIDTTEQKSLELQFAQSQKMQAVGQLAGGIAHDFNNLLTAIIGFCDLLLVKHEAGDPSFADVMQIKQNANRAANLVRQLLAFSRQQTLRPKIIQLTDVLADLSNLLSRLLGENITLNINHGRELGAVKVDQGQLEQVIINLAVNARDAMLEGGTLTIETFNLDHKDVKKRGHTLIPPADYVCITVTDQGTGIPKEHLGKIFEPFFTTKDVGKGTGLGLSTVYGIIKQTGGYVFPVSEEGKGTTFEIYLPRHDDLPEQKPKVEDSAALKTQDLTGRGTILLVEDESAVRSFAVRALSNRGYEVLEADNGQTALDIVTEYEGEIDLIVSDVVMPEMDGPTLLAEVRKLRPDTKIIFISGYAEDAFRKNLNRDEEFTFLPKPFSLKQLAATVKEVISG